jgi:5-methylcytosine-specific restriction endonuclease McrA
MARKIVVYGNSDTRKKFGFPSRKDFKRYIEHDVFADGQSRYLYTQCKDADLIVLSREGLAYGHFDISSKVRPTVEDRRRYSPVKCVYLVNKSTLYDNPVELSTLGITKIRFGKLISEMLFRKIQDLAGKTEEYETIVLAEELPVGTYREGAASRILVNAYERNPAAVKACKAHYGTRCQVCGLDLGERYGEIGKGFIHVHHLKQLSKVGGKYEVDPIADLRPVCPNCHAIMHRKTPPLAIDEMKLRMVL